MKNKAQDEAKRLVEKYIAIMPHIKNQTGYSIVEHAKNCALVLVGEIILSKNGHGSTSDIVISYYKEVENEIVNYYHE